MRRDALFQFLEPVLNDVTLPSHGRALRFCYEVQQAPHGDTRSKSRHGPWKVAVPRYGDGRF